MLVKTERENLIKDLDTGAVLNTDMVGLEAYKKRRMSINETSSRLDKVERDVGDIKNMLKILMEKLS